MGAFGCWSLCFEGRKETKEAEEILTNSKMWFVYRLRPAVLGEEEGGESLSVSLTPTPSPNTLHTTNFLFFSTGYRHLYTSQYQHFTVSAPSGARAVAIRWRVCEERSRGTRDSAFTSKSISIGKPLYHEVVLKCITKPFASRELCQESTPSVTRIQLRQMGMKGKGPKMPTTDRPFCPYTPHLSMHPTRAGGVQVPQARGPRNKLQNLKWSPPQCQVSKVSQ